MFRIGFVVVCSVLIACGGGEKEEQDNETGFSYERFSKLFRTIRPPYTLSDTGLAKNKDTTRIRSAPFAGFLSDSLKKSIFGQKAKPRYTALVRVEVSDKTSLYLVKAEAGSKKAALVYAFDDGTFSGVMPFLVPDADASTSQATSIDKVFAINKTIVQRKQNSITGEGKEVYGYDASLKQFSLILTNPMNASDEVINPIDTFSRRHKLAGDYVKNRKNFVSVRDGRRANELLVFVHIDQNRGECTGELKGDLLMTSPTTGVYRQGGDPCVMIFRFGSSSVTIKEDQGCGSHRGIDCQFNGTFTRKKETKGKQSTKKKQSG